MTYVTDDICILIALLETLEIIIKLIEGHEIIIILKILRSVYLRDFKLNQ